MHSRVESALTFDTFLGWYLPAWVIGHRALLMLVGMGVGLISGFVFKKRGQIKCGQVGSIALFVFIYTVFLIISSSTTAFDLIGGRLLSPVYLPLTLLVLFVIQAALRPNEKDLLSRIFNTALIFGVIFWLLFPLVATEREAKIADLAELEYNGDVWRGSATVQYLLQDGAFVRDYPIYSNAPEIVYMLANMKSKNTPAKLKHFFSTETDLPLSVVKDQWPPANKIYLIWFINLGPRGYLYSVDELKEIVNLEPIAQFDDGVVFIASRK